MNKRIEELANKAGFHFDEYNEVTQRKVELLAELFVRECIDTINGVPNGYRDYRNQIEDAMREDCVDAVKQKFGVE